MIDITIVTAKAYDNPKDRPPYVQNIFKEYELLKNALTARGFSVHRTYWDDPDFDWATTKVAVIRTVWDYFERFEAFNHWMEEAAKLTQLINPLGLQQWNSHKFYLRDLEKNGVRIVPTEFVAKNTQISLKEISANRSWNRLVIKPAISAAAFHTYKVMEDEIETMEHTFQELLSSRDLLVLEYQETITTIGEASLMVFNGKYTHAILKRAKAGDFRVQDDFGGTVHDYEPSPEEIEFAEFANAQCPEKPAYGRVDIVWDTEGTCYLSEMEFLDPEIWIRNAPESAEHIADSIAGYLV
ncbi:MAG: hypothetical protein KTR22_01430 [Flavobacteriaceae bacterium]|nr:hypothetical protein [Flavobacteriaceae bacterium]